MFTLRTAMIVTFITSDDDGALDLLKQHSGIVWAPERFTGFLRGREVRRLGTLLPLPVSTAGRPGARVVDACVGFNDLLKQHSSIVWDRGGSDCGWALFGNCLQSSIFLPEFLKLSSLRSRQLR